MLVRLVHMGARLTPHLSFQGLHFRLQQYQRVCVHRLACMWATQAVRYMLCLVHVWMLCSILLASNVAVLREHAWCRVPQAIVDCGEARMVRLMYFVRWRIILMRDSLGAALSWIFKRLVFLFHEICALHDPPWRLLSYSWTCVRARQRSCFKAGPMTIRDDLIWSVAHHALFILHC